MNKKLLLLSGVLTCTTLFGVPAKQGFRQQTQPDNTLISLQLTGDEFLHYYITTDNHIVLEDTDGYYKYAASQNGKLVISNMIAHNPNERTEAEKEFLKQIDKSGLIQTASTVRMNSVQRRNADVSKASTFPTTGSMPGIILLVQFQDKKFSVSSPNETYTNQANQENYSSNGATGSIRDYFIAQSSGLFTPQFDVVGPITMSKEMSYYGGNDSNGNDLRPGQMVKEACEIAVSKHNIDFSKYDADKDGYVDFVYVIYAGYAEAQGGSANTIWPHKWDLSSQSISLTLNGKKINTYACSSELRGASGVNMDGIGTFCHEFSHCLGLPDFYPTNSAKNFGMGEWDIMDQGNYNNNSKTPAGYSAYEKSCVNWLQLTELKDPQQISLDELHSNNQAYVVYSDVNKNEFFVLENRQKTNKWDAYLPGSGLLITHVDYLESAWKNNVVNNTVGHQRVSLVPADNELMLYSNSNYAAYVNSLYGDPYPGTTGNTSFTDTSVPAASLYTGGKLGKPITRITHTDGIVTFNFMTDGVGIPTPLAATNISATGFTANWNQIEGATSYSLQIAEVKNGEMVFGEDFNNLKAGTMTQPDSKEISSTLDSYTTTKGWSGSKVYQAGGCCKLGSNSTPSGKLITPAIDLSKAGNTVTIYYTAKGKAGIANGIQFSLTTDAGGTAVIASKSMDLSTQMLRKCVVFDNVSTASYLKVLSGEVTFIDDLKIYTGDVSDEEPQSVNTRTVSLPTVIENITTSSYEITGLSPESTYSYKVMAYKDSFASDWSSSVKVTTLVTTGIQNNLFDSSVRIVNNQIIIDATAGIPVSIFQTNGINVFTGYTTNEPLSVSCEKGIYIIRVADKSTKIAITQ